MTISANEQIPAAANAMIPLIVVGVIANALGLLAVGAAIPAGVPATDRGLRDLRETFGGDLIAIAIKKVGKDDIVILAKEVGNMYLDRMRKKYGDWQTTKAIAAAPPGDLRAANEIAAALAGQKATEITSSALTDAAVSTGKKRAGGKKTGQPQKDTKTGTTYTSKAKAGMAVAAEYGLDPTETFIWYAVIKKDPKRFVPA